MLLPDSAIQQVLDTALAEEGVREVGQPNCGPRVEEYLAAVHWRKGAPWCAAFVGWCGKEALGDHWPLPLVPGTWTLHDHAQRYSLLEKTPARGDVFLTFSQARGSWHTGFVLDLDAGALWRTIEGNTNAQGAHNGDGVYQRVRRFGGQDRFIRWVRALAD